MVWNRPLLVQAVLSLTFLFVSAPSRAETLSWEACVREATANSPEIAAAAEAMKSAEAQSSGAYSNFFPQLSGTLGYSNGNSSSVSALGIVTGTSQTIYSAGLSVSQNVFSGFQDVGKIRQTQANLESARAGLAAAKANLSSSLKSAFAELLYQQKSVDFAEMILKRQQANLRLVTLRFEGGRENKGNQLFQSAQVEQAKYQHHRALRQVRAGASQLAAVLGRPEGMGLRVEGALVTIEPKAPASFVDLAAQVPSYRQARYQRIAAEAAVDVANSGWYPSLNLTGFVGKTGENFFPSDTSRWSVGATLSIPLFPGTSTIFNVQSAHALERQANFNERNIQNKLIATLEGAYASLVDAVELVHVNEAFESAVKTRSTISTEKYNTGLMSFDDWSIIETDLVNRGLNLLLSRRNAMQAEAAWENAQGTGAIP